MKKGQEGIAEAPEWIRCYYRYDWISFDTYFFSEKEPFFPELATVEIGLLWTPPFTFFVFFSSLLHCFHITTVGEHWHWLTGGQQKSLILLLDHYFLASFGCKTLVFYMIKKSVRKSGSSESGKVHTRIHPSSTLKLNYPCSSPAFF